jgi:1-acyl-sn-glycerol-3-phosphate acyltransferase
MPQIQTSLQYTDRTTPPVVPAQRQPVTVTPVAHRADAWSRISYTCVKNILSPAFRMLWRPVVEGLENIPEQGAAILASNHLSVLDSAFLAMAVRRRITFLAKSEYFSTPGLKGRAQRLFVGATGQISVDRNNRRKASAAIRAGANVLERGELLGIYPEGTRSPDGRLYRGRNGVARLTLDTGAPVIPIGMVGTFQVLPASRRLPRSGRVHIRIGAPLHFAASFTEPNGRAQRAVTEEIMRSIGDLSGQQQTDIFADQFKKAIGLAGKP